MRHLLTLFDLSSDELTELLGIATDLKSEFVGGLREPAYAGYMLGLLFEKPSLRTRVSFESAMTHLGGDSIFLGAEAGWGTRESLKDFTQVLTSYVDAIVFRGNKHGLLERFTSYAQCPVINGLTDRSHPCQAIGDVLTMQELHGQLEGQKLVFVGDGNNVARSLAVACAMLGVRFVLAAPDGYQLSPDFVKSLLAAYPQAQLEQIPHPHTAIEAADIIYSDVWTSMGQESQLGERRAAFAPFQVNAALMQSAGPQARFMHCLPARRGEEVSDEVMDSPQSAVIQQAANRLHAQKAILTWLFQHR